MSVLSVCDVQHWVEIANGKSRFYGVERKDGVQGICNLEILAQKKKEGHKTSHEVNVQLSTK